MSNKSSRDLDKLADLLYSWGYDRGFFEKGGATLEGQMKLLVAEVVEAALEVDKDTMLSHEFYVEVGDILVTAIMLCHTLGVRPDYCLGLAYDKIKDRKGRFVKGKFTKESDL